MKILLEGNLAYVSMFNLLQFIKLEQKHSLVHVKVKEIAQEAKVYFEYGRIVYAELNRLLGGDAMYRLIGWWDYGNFQFMEVPQDELPTDNIHESLDSILMESARYMDEFADIRQKCPSLASGLAFTAKSLQMVDEGQLPDFCKMLPRSFTVARFFDICPYSHWDAMMFLREMFRYNALVSQDRAAADELRSTNRLTPIDSLEGIVMEFVGIDDSRRFIDETLKEHNYDRSQNFGFAQLLGLADGLINRMRPFLRDDDEVQEVTYRLRARITSLL
ncbi:MAG: DUF4388 domain-containing protein [Candidatus Sericytochromatia bacterium]